MAAIHNGQLNLDCTNCDENKKNVFGCVKPAQVAVWGVGEDFFLNCPLRFIDRWANTFIDAYNYYDKYGCTINYFDQDNKFLEAGMYYRSQICEQSKKTSNASDRITSRLKSGFNARRKNNG